MGFPRQEYWSALPFSPLGDLPNPGIEPTSPVSPTLQADSLPRSHWGKPYWIFAPSPKSICWNPNPNGMVSASGHFGRWLGYEGEALDTLGGDLVMRVKHSWMVLVSLQMRPQRPFFLSTTWGHSKKTLSITRKGILTRRWIYLHLALGFSCLQIYEK